MNTNAFASSLKRFLLAGASGLALTLSAATFPAQPTPGDRLFAEYFRAETARLAERTLADIRTLEDWRVRQARARQELREMLGLEPLPPRTDLQPVVTGRIDHDEFTVEKLHFQSRPGLYVTANLYLPKNQPRPAPAILYVCGHSLVKTNGVSYGNKTAYQHHGLWFARHGYVCLVLDTLQLGEIEGAHHGTHRLNQWWWNSRGYTPAGVEAWNGIRALDYLETRPEVDARRLGITGRSGGGAYSWTVAALDERVRVAAPVAGITDLHNYVVDGAVEGHCDCMFFVNTYGWDYPLLAALTAPRPLLLCNTDKDTIFPLDGVLRVHSAVRRIYNLHQALPQLGLLITEGPHKDTQDLQVPVFRWFNRFLKQEEPLIEKPAVKLFPPEQLRVFTALPADQRNTRIQEEFVPPAKDDSTTSTSDLVAALRAKVFGGWPEAETPLQPRLATQVKRDGLSLSVWEFDSQPGLPLRLYELRRADLEQPEAVEFLALGQSGYLRVLKLVGSMFGRELARELELAGLDPHDLTQDAARDAFADLAGRVRESRSSYVAFAPRGAGLTALTEDDRYVIQVRRRFMLLGQTLDGMRVWDLRRAVQAVQQAPGLAQAPITLHATGSMACNALLASLFDPAPARLNLREFPRDDKAAPDYLNLSRVASLPRLVERARSRCEVNLAEAD